jgi:hypothetical protein
MGDDKRREPGLPEGFPSKEERLAMSHADWSHLAAWSIAQNLRRISLEKAGEEFHMPPYPGPPRDKSKLEAEPVTPAPQPKRWVSWDARLYALWIALPLLTIHGLIAAFSERRPVAAFAETVVADVLHIVEIAVPVALAAWLGAIVFRRSGLAWLGWVVGLAVLIGAGWILYGAFDELPGVGERIQAMKEAEGLE